MDKKIKIIIGVVIISLIASYIDVIFFRSYLYQGITGASALFFIRTFIEFVVFGLGIIFGMSINLIRSKK